jgi:hypothetical protein
MSESETEITSAWKPTDFSALPSEPVSGPVPSANSRLLARVPLYLSLAAYVYTFLLVQLPEFSHYSGVRTVGDQARALVWSVLPGTGSTGAGGLGGVAVLLMYVGSVALFERSRGISLPYSLTLGSAALITLGAIGRIIDLAASGEFGRSWGGVALLIVLAAAGLGGAREIAVASPPVARTQSWRLMPAFVVFAISWLGPVAIGRYVDGDRIVAASRALPDSDPWYYLKQDASWWFYLIGLLVAGIVLAAVELLPPWKDRSKRLVAAAIGIVALAVGIQQSDAPTRDAVDSILGPVSEQMPSNTSIGRACAVASTDDGERLHTLVITGNRCDDIELFVGPRTTGSAKVGVPLASSKHAIEFAPYGSFIVVPVPAQPGRPPGLLALSIASGKAQWRVSCPAGTKSADVRFSGSSIGDDRSAGRQTIARGSVTSYVALHCGTNSTFVVDPVTGHAAPVK